MGFSLWNFGLAQTKAHRLKPMPRSSKLEFRRITLRFLSVYKTVETGLPPTPEEMAVMGKLIEEGMKAGWLLAVGGCLPSAKGARVGQSHGNVVVTDGPF